MEASDYLQSGESVLCETTAIRADSLGEEDEGELICTDSRLIFVDGKKVTDISLRGVSEIVTASPTYLNRFAGWALIFLIGSFFAYLILPEIPEVEAFAIPVTGLFLLVAGIETALAIYYAKWTVKVVTPQSEYKFMSGDSSLQNIPHAIRGAAN